MGKDRRRVFERMYRQSRKPEDLPWHHAEPTPFLPDAHAARSRPGHALDLGCGTGIDTVWLAQQGWQVTALDFMPQAIELTRQRAAEAGVGIEAIRADVLEWQAPRSFDLIVDAGCLHGLPWKQRPGYRERILRWLAEGGDYLLTHFDRRHLLDWRPIGPKRIPRRRILEFFAPELVEQAHRSRHFSGRPLPIGPTFIATTYWFRRA